MGFYSIRNLIGWISTVVLSTGLLMKQWLFNKMVPHAIRFREWSKGKTWIQIPLWIFILWLLGVANPYWCVYPVCWIT